MIKVDALLTVGARYQVALKAGGLLNKQGELSLSPEQDNLAENLQERWLTMLKKEIKSKTKLNRLMLREEPDA